MVSSWLVVACLSALVSRGYSAAVSTTRDTLVVSRSDEDTTEPSPSPDLTTDEPAPPVKLMEMNVDSFVTLRYAHTGVVAKVKNPAKKAQEADFRVLLPETAFISGFIMTIDGKSYKAYVKEKEEAKQIYDDAVSHGLGAAHVSAKARDSNQFIVSVNLEPKSTVIFNLTYEELLVRRNGVYNHAINLHPGALVPKMTIKVHIKESDKITELRVPEIRTGNEIDATKEDAQNSKVVITRGHDDREATITFTPDLEDQKKLMEIYAEKSRQSRQQHSPSIWSYTNEEEPKSAEGVLGQFVVQYDVDRSDEGQILVNDGYFVHFFAPSALAPLNKYVVFVLDTSGSMMDRKIVQLREAMQAILTELNPGDFFSIVEFSSSVTIHDLKEADQEPPKRYYSYSEYEKTPALVPPSPVTRENINRAKVIISRLDAAGGTNIASALDTAVNLIHKRAEWGKKPKTNDTEPSTTPATVVDPALENIERMRSLEPIIIFLTDGDPTIGETNPTTIMNRLTEKNFGEHKASIFSLAFGEDADRKFLRKLSLRNDGFMRHIYEAADAALQLADFYRQVSSPLLADVKFTYPADQVKEGSVTKNKFRTYYAGSELVVAGRLVGAALTPAVQGFCGTVDGGNKRYDKTPKAPIPAQKSEYLPLERMWSYLTIRQLLDQKDAADGDDNKEDGPAKKALALALKYEFVTALTSLVVVKPNATKAVNAESVDKPTSMPFSHAPALSGSIGGGFSYAMAPAAPQYNQFMSQAQLIGEAGNVDYELEEIEEGGLYDKINPDFNRASLVSNYYASSLPSSLSNVSTWPLRKRRPIHAPPTADHIVMSMARADGFDSLRAYIADDLAYEYEDTVDSAMLSTSYISTTPQQTPTTPQQAPTTTQQAPAPGAEYSLQDFHWTLPLINTTADTLTLQVNGTTLDLKLAKYLNNEVPKKADGDASCAAAVDGGAGVCVYLTRCGAARNIDIDIYKTTYCSVNDGYAGVCCQPAKVAN